MMDVLQFRINRSHASLRWRLPLLNRLLGAEMHCILESTNFNSDNSLILYVYNMDNKTKRKVVSKIESIVTVVLDFWGVVKHYRPHTHTENPTKVCCWMSSQLFLPYHNTHPNNLLLRLID